jgi:hypothetical protein
LKQCRAAPVRDTIDVGGVTKPIDYMTISAPTPGDIERIAKAAPSVARDIDFRGAGAAVAPLYLVPTDANVTPRPFSGLIVSGTQPASAVMPGQTPKPALRSFVTNTINVPIKCYGDVVVKGDLFLESPAFVSDSRGCRIHATGTIFLHATPTPTPGAAATGNTVTGTGNVGVQLTSAVAVLMGLTVDEAESRGVPADALKMMKDLSLPDTAMCLTAAKTAVRKIWVPVRNTSELQCPSGTTYSSDDLTAPAGLVGWDWGYVDYSGLMLNGLQVQGRYQGQLMGSVIADYALFRLGHMNFAFDKRFDGQVPFPRLQTIKSDLGGHPRIIFDAGACTGAGTDSWQCSRDAVQ